MSTTCRPVSAATTNSQTKAHSAVRVRHKKISDPIPFTPNSPFQVSEAAQRQHRTWQASGNNGPTLTKTNFSGEHLGSDSVNSALLEPGHRKSNAMSTTPSNVSATSTEHLPSQEKDVGFRATIRRMLGSQKYKNNPGRSKLQHHGSHANLEHGQGRNSKRSRSQHSQFRHRAVASTGALNSHPLPDLRINTTASPRIPSIPSPSPYQRRNTLPTLLLKDEETETNVAATPRTIEMERPPPQRYVQEQRLINRRSRSADAMVTMLNQTSPRTGSHFREPGSASSKARLPLRAAAPSTPESSAHFETLSTVSRTKSNSDPVQPPQAFDFGLRHGGLTKPSSVEQRINVLEVKLVDFEYALAKLQENNSIQAVKSTVDVEETPLHESAIGGSSPSSMTTSSTKETSCPGSPSQAIAHRVPTPHPRYSSGVTTIRSDNRADDAQRSQSPIPSSLMLVLNQTEQLIQLLEEERIARQQMEMHILELQKEVQMLREPVYASVKKYDHSQPTPRSQESTEWDGVFRTLHRSAPFRERRLPEKPYETSRFSMTESEVETEDDLTEVYKTPQERYLPFEEQRGRPAITMF